MILMALKSEDVDETVEETGNSALVPCMRLIRCGLGVQEIIGRYNSRGMLL